jgi:hypothetical protein
MDCIRIFILRGKSGVKQAIWSFRVKGLHYAWVTLGIAIAMRLVSSVERTASLLKFPSVLSSVCCRQ